MSRRTVFCAAGALCLAALVVGGVRPRPSGGGSSSPRSPLFRFLPLGGSRGEGPAAEGLLEGRVLSAEGVPVDGARVVASGEEDFRAVPTPVGKTVTSGGGRFRLSGLSPGRYSLTASLADHLPALKRGIELGPGGALHDLTLVLGGAIGALTGRVEDSGGGPIAGAEVKAIAVEASSGMGPLLLAESGPDGRYALALAAGSYWLTASAKGYGASSRMVTAGPGSRVDFVLTPAAALEGVVTGEDGKPVAGASVEAAPDYGSGRVSTMGGPRSAQAGAEGRFLIEDLEPGSWKLSARKGPLAGLLAQPVAITVAQHLDGLTIVLRTERVVSGHVSGGRGAPVSGARLTIQDQGRIEATSSEDGSYRLEGVFPGRHMLTASAPGFAKQWGPVVVGGEDLVHDLTLSPGATVSGRVFDPSGRPVGGASVTSRGRDGQGTLTDADGGYRLVDLKPGKLALEAELDRVGRVIAPEMELAEGEGRTVDLTLVAGPSVMGSVHWDDGSPAGGARVVAMAQAFRATAVVDTSGHYALDPMVEGSARVWASGGADPLFGYGRHGGDDGHRLLLGPADHLQGIDFVLPRENRTIEGKVTGVDGTPVGDATVTAERDANYSFPDAVAYSREDGAFLLTGLTAGKYTLRALHPAWGPGALEAVDADTKEAKVVLPLLTLLGGKVTDRSGAAVQDYSLTARSTHRGGMQRALEVHDPTGAFSLLGLGPDTYNLSVSAADGKVGTLKDLVLAPGERRNDLVVVAGTGVTLTGRILVFGTDAPVAGAQLWANGGMGSASSSPVTGADGRFSLAGLAPGSTVRVGAFLDQPRQHDWWLFTLPNQDDQTVDLGVLRMLPSGSPGGTAGTGIRPESREGRGRVSGVTPGSPAAANGIQSGSILDSIAGQPVAGLGTVGLTDLLGGPPGSTVTVGLIGPDGTGRVVDLARR